MLLGVLLLVDTTSCLAPLESADREGATPTTMSASSELVARSRAAALAERNVRLGGTFDDGAHRISVDLALQRDPAVATGWVTVGPCRWRLYREASSIQLQFDAETGTDASPRARIGHRILIRPDQGRQMSALLAMPTGEILYLTSFEAVIREITDIPDPILVARHDGDRSVESVSSGLRSNNRRLFIDMNTHLPLAVEPTSTAPDQMTFSGWSATAQRPFPTSSGSIVPIDEADGQLACRPN